MGDPTPQKPQFQRMTPPGAQMHQNRGESLRDVVGAGRCVLSNRLNHFTPKFHLNLFQYNACSKVLLAEITYAKDWTVDIRFCHIWSLFFYFYRWKAHLVCFNLKKNASFHSKCRTYVVNFLHRWHISEALLVPVGFIFVRCRLPILRVCWIFSSLQTVWQT